MGDKGQLPKKGKEKWKKYLKKLGPLSVCIGVLTTPDYGFDDALGDLTGSGDLE